MNKIPEYLKVSESLQITALETICGLLVPNTETLN